MRKDIISIYNEIINCNKCRLSESTNTRVLMKNGNDYSKLLFVAEAPGSQEETQGEPLVGRAGKYFTNILRNYGIKRKNIWIENILHCRPPNNRRPKEDEIDICIEYLLEIICVIKPMVIVTMGKTAINALIQRPYEAPVSTIRGRLKKHSFHYEWIEEDISHTCYVIPTWHPSYVLRNRGKQIEEEFKTDILKACIKSEIGKGI